MKTTTYKVNAHIHSETQKLKCNILSEKHTWGCYFAARCLFLSKCLIVWKWQKWQNLEKKLVQREVCVDKSKVLTLLLQWFNSSRWTLNHIFSCHKKKKKFYANVMTAVSQSSSHLEVSLPFLMGLFLNLDYISFCFQFLPPNCLHTFCTRNCVFVIMDVMN